MQNFNWVNTNNIKFNIIVNSKMDNHDVAYYLTYMIGTAIQIYNYQSINNENFKNKISKEI